MPVFGRRTSTSNGDVRRQYPKSDALLDDKRAGRPPANIGRSVGCRLARRWAELPQEDVKLRVSSRA